MDDGSDGQTPGDHHNVQAQVHQDSTAGHDSHQLQSGDSHDIDGEPMTNMDIKIAEEVMQQEPTPLGSIRLNPDDGHSSDED